MTNHHNLDKVVTWQSPNGETINLTRDQEKQFLAAWTWPRDSRGEEYCTVYHGLHAAQHPIGW